MTDSVFNVALLKRFTDSDEIVTIDVTSADTLLIRDSATGVLLKLPFSTLSSAISTAFASSFAALVDGKVPSSQLPSYVDDVLEFANLAAFPATGETGKIYVSIATNLTYRWSGSTYVEIASSPGSTDVVSEGSTNLYFTNARALAAAPAETAISIGALINAATVKTTPLDADTLGVVDSTASNVLKKLSWSNIKATLKTYFDAIYNPIADNGNWTPIFSVTSGSIPTKSPYTSGKYFKIGKLVVATGFIVADVPSSPTGTLKITGLPFNVASGFEFTSSASLYGQGFSASGGSVMGLIDNNDSKIIVRTLNTSGVAVDMAVSMQEWAQFSICAIYITT